MLNRKKNTLKLKTGWTRVALVCDIYWFDRCVILRPCAREFIIGFRVGLTWQSTRTRSVTFNQHKPFDIYFARDAYQLIQAP